MAPKKLTVPLTARQIDQLTTERNAERFPDGIVPCLYMKVSKTGAKSWVFMRSRNGRQTEIGLGSWAAKGRAGRVSIPLARKKAWAFHDQIGEGKDPLAEKRRDTVTFGSCADQLVDSLKGGWKNPKTTQNWTMVLTDHAAKLRAKPVASITVEHVLEVLKPLWLNKPEVAGQLRIRIAKVIDFATVKGYRSGANPAAWRANLDHLLPKQPKLIRGHHTALAYADLPAFMTKLSGLTAPGIKPLALTTLTAARTSEVRLATWSEFDLGNALWTVPAARTKTGKEHRVPLSQEALAVLQSLPKGEGSDLIFPDCAPNTMLRALKRIDGSLTAHGMRSAFKDWAANETHFARETIEECLGHLVGNDVERAYRRGQALEKRRAVLSAWAAYVSGGEKVVALKAAAS